MAQDEGWKTGMKKWEVEQGKDEKVSGPAGENEEARGTTEFENFLGQLLFVLSWIGVLFMCHAFTGIKKSAQVNWPPHWDHGKNPKTHLKPT